MIRQRQSTLQAKLASYTFKFIPATTIMYYYPYPFSRAATILWGRLATCGRLLIGLLASLTNANTVCACRYAGQVANLRPIGGPSGPGLPCGAANPGCSRLPAEY